MMMVVGRVNGSMARELLSNLVSSGNAEQISKSTFLMYWKKPTQWADTIYEYVQRTGMTGSVVTVYELILGDEAEGEVFHGLPDIWPRVFKALERSGRAALFGAESLTAEAGIKFI